MAPFLMKIKPNVSPVPEVNLLLLETGSAMIALLVPSVLPKRVLFTHADLAPQVLTLILELSSVKNARKELSTLSFYKMNAFLVLLLEEYLAVILVNHAPLEQSLISLENALLAHLDNTNLNSERLLAMIAHQAPSSTPNLTFASPVKMDGTHMMASLVDCVSLKQSLTKVKEVPMAVLIKRTDTLKSQE